MFVAVVLVAAYVSFRSGLSRPYRSQGQNAVWAAHEWVGRAWQAADYDAFAERLRAGGITDVFVHVGPLAPDGSIDPSRHPNASIFASQMHARLPALRIQAWIGQVERRGGGPLDLSKPGIRERIVTTAAGFVGLGFDGIHYDIEPIYPGDRDFLDLLRRTRAAVPTRVLSVASVYTEPFTGFGTVTRTVFGGSHLWTGAYYGDVVAEVDQVAVMLYGTAMPSDWLYGTLVRRETARILGAVGSTATVFFGIPTYDEASLTHHPRAENVESGIRGVQKGLGPFPAGEVRRVGVAIYAEWTTDEHEWAIYRRGWLGSGG